MPLTVFAVVLLGAAMHAAWNAALKGGGDTVLMTILIAAGAGLVAAAVLPFLPQPAPASWPWLAVSASTHVVYFSLVAGSYRHSDMHRAYPLMRGTAPVLVAVVGAIWLGEHLPPLAWAGIALVSAGVFAMALAGSGHGSRLGTGLALLNAGVIATYTLIDGNGVRLSGAAPAYTLWLSLLSAIPLTGWALVTRRRSFLAFARRRLPLGLVAGVGSMVSYGLALWAMTKAPVAMVAALRETSILFAMAIAGLVLGERIGRVRLAAGALIALGAVGLRLA